MRSALLCVIISVENSEFDALMMNEFNMHSTDRDRFTYFLPYPSIKMGMDMDSEKVLWDGGWLQPMGWVRLVWLVWNMR